MSNKNGIAWGLALLFASLFITNLFIGEEELKQNESNMDPKESIHHQAQQNIKTLEEQLQQSRLKIKDLEFQIGTLQAELKLKQDEEPIEKELEELLEKSEKVISEVKTQTLNKEDKKLKASKQNNQTSDEAFLEELKGLSLRSRIKKAIDSDRPKAIEYLIQSGIDVNREKVDKLPILIYAASKGRAKSTASLLEYGAQVDIQDAEGFTALSWVKNKEIATLLVKAGANLNHKSLKNQTPLHYAHHGDIAKIFIENGADINAKDQYGKTPIFSLRSRSAMRAVVAAGADLNVEDNSGKTVLDYALDRNDQVKADIIKEGGGGKGSKSLVGKLIGVGISLSYREGLPLITHVVEGGPASQQGISKGDRILEIAQGYSGERAVSTSTKNYRSLSSFIRGPVGSIVQFKVKKEDGSTRTVWIERNVIKRSSTRRKG